MTRLKEHSALVILYVQHGKHTVVSWTCYHMPRLAQWDDPFGPFLGREMSRFKARSTAQARLVVT